RPGEILSGSQRFLTFRKARLAVGLPVRRRVRAALRRIGEHAIEVADRAVELAVLDRLARLIVERVGVERPDRRHDELERTLAGADAGTRTASDADTRLRTRLWIRLVRLRVRL